MTMILVTHEMGFARRADRVLFMRDGKVRESGPIGEVFADPRTSELRQFIASAL
jgi:polar amino acid transport system ATP-binding protein